MFTTINVSAIVLQREARKKDDAQGTFGRSFLEEKLHSKQSGTLVSDCWLACNIPDYKFAFFPSSGRQTGP